MEISGLLTFLRENYVENFKLKLHMEMLKNNVALYTNAEIQLFFHVPI